MRKLNSLYISKILVHGAEQHILVGSTQNHQFEVCIVEIIEFTVNKIVKSKRNIRQCLPNNNMCCL